MELKLKKLHPKSSIGLLLIVPYGIETNMLNHHHLLSNLLIVPYGIETIQYLL